MCVPGRPPAFSEIVDLVQKLGRDECHRLFESGRHVGVLLLVPPRIQVAHPRAKVCRGFVSRKTVVCRNSVVDCIL